MSYEETYTAYQITNVVGDCAELIFAIQLALKYGWFDRSKPASPTNAATVAQKMSNAKESMNCLQDYLNEISLRQCGWEVRKEND